MIWREKKSKVKHGEGMLKENGKIGGVHSSCACSHLCHFCSWACGGEKNVPESKGSCDSRIPYLTFLWCPLLRPAQVGRMNSLLACQCGPQAMIWAKAHGSLAWHANHYSSEVINYLNKSISCTYQLPYSTKTVNPIYVIIKSIVYKRCLISVQCFHADDNGKCCKDKRTRHRGRGAAAFTVNLWLPVGDSFINGKKLFPSR